MTSANTIWQVARREITERGKSKAYLITSLVTLMIVIGLIVIPGLFSGGTHEYVIGTVGEANEAIVAAAEKLGNARDEPDEDPSVALSAIKYASREEAEADLEEGEIEAVLVDGEEVIVENDSGLGGSSLVSLLQQSAVSVALEVIVSENGQAAADVIELMTSNPLKTTSLTGEESGSESRALVAFGGLMLLYMAVLLYGTWILTGVTEEKTNRVVEVLLSSVRPWQLLAGKILGIGVLGIGQFTGTILIAAITLQATGTIDLPDIDALAIVNLVVWFVLGFMLFAVMFGAAGSLVSRMEDAQNVAFPMSLTAVAGFFAAIRSLEDPDGLAAVIGTFVPLTAPFVVPVRASLDAIPLWQHLTAIILTIATIAGLTLVAGRIYAGALLRFGSRVKVREAWRSGAE